MVDKSEKPKRRNPASAKNGEKGAEHGIKGKEHGIRGKEHGIKGAEFGKLGGAPKLLNAEQMIARLTECIPEILDQVKKLALTATNDNVKLAACREILDRVYGKPTQSISGAGGGPVQLTIKWEE